MLIQTKEKYVLLHLLRLEKRYKMLTMSEVRHHSVVGRMLNIYE